MRIALAAIASLALSFGAHHVAKPLRCLPYKHHVALPGVKGKYLVLYCPIR